MNFNENPQGIYKNVFQMLLSNYNKGVKKANEEEADDVGDDAEAVPQQRKLVTIAQAQRPSQNLSRASLTASTVPSATTVSNLSEFIKTSNYLDNELNQIISELKMNSKDDFYVGGSENDQVPDTQEQETVSEELTSQQMHAFAKQAETLIKSVNDTNTLYAVLQTIKPDEVNKTLSFKHMQNALIAHIRQQNSLNEKLAEADRIINLLQDAPAPPPSPEPQEPAVDEEEQQRIHDELQRQLAEEAAQKAQKEQEAMEHAIRAILTTFSKPELIPIAQSLQIAGTARSSHESIIEDIVRTIMSSDHTALQHFMQGLNAEQAYHMEFERLINLISDASNDVPVSLRSLVPRPKFNIVSRSPQQLTAMQSHLDDLYSIKSIGNLSSEVFFNSFKNYGSYDIKMRSIIKAKFNAMSKEEIAKGMYANGFRFQKRSFAHGNQHGNLQGLKEVTKEQLWTIYSIGSYPEDFNKDHDITKNKDFSIPTRIKTITNIIDSLIVLAKPLATTKIQSDEYDKIQSMYDDMKEKVHILTTLNTKNTQITSLQSKFATLYRTAITQGIRLGRGYMTGGVMLLRSSTLDQIHSKYHRNIPSHRF